VEFLGTVGRDRPDVAKAVLETFADESPYVLAQAAIASARLKTRPAVHPLAKLLDDDRTDRTESAPWRTPDGTTGRRVHGGPSRNSTVSQAAFQAMAALSDGGLVPQPAEADPAATHASNVKAAKAWYAKAKRGIPTSVEVATAAPPASGPSAAKPTPQRKTLPVSTGTGTTP
jgi:hypothetical protein